MFIPFTTHNYGHAHTSINIDDTFLYFALNISSCSLRLQLALYDHKKELRKLLGRYVCRITLFAIIVFEILYQFLLLRDDFF